MPDPFKNVKIIELMELFDDDEVTTADKIDRPQSSLDRDAFDDFNTRNPLAGGGMLVQPGFGGTRQGYANPKGNPEFGKTITGAKFKDTIRPQNLEKLKKLEEIITKSNSQYKKSLTSKAALELAGFKDGYQAIATTGKLREEVKKLIGTLQSTGDKMDNYINNVMLSEDALVKDFKSPIKHLQKKFGVTSGFTDKWAKTSKVYQDNKRLFNNLANDLSFNKYKKYADGTPRLMSDFSVLVQNKLPSSMPFMRGDSAEKFILQSAYRHFKYNKDVGKASKITFIGDPDLLPINEWKFIKGGKLFSLDPAEDTIKFQGKKYKNNYLNRVDAKDIYKNDFGDVYKIFDDLEKYMNTTTVIGNKDVKLDTVLRRKLFDATSKKDYLLRRAVEIDHFDINKDPFSNLRLLDRRTNVQAGLIKRLPKYKNNPKLLNKVLTDIGYTTPYKDVDTFIKRTTRNIDKPIKTIGETSFAKTSKAGAEAGFVDLDLFKDIGKGADRFLFRPLTAIEAPTLAIPQSAYAASKLASDVAKGQETDTSALDITLPTAVSSLAASKKFGLDLFADNAGKVKRFLRGPFTQSGVRALSRGSLFATPFIETAIQGYNARQALLKAREKYGTDDMVPTAVGMAPREYVKDLAIENQKFEGEGLTPFSAAGGGIAKQAGDRSGPPPEKGPMSQGLSGLLKRANKI